MINISEIQNNLNNLKIDANKYLEETGYKSELLEQAKNSLKEMKKKMKE